MKRYRHLLIGLYSLIAALVLAGCTNNPEEKRTPGDVIDDNALEFVIEREIKASDEGFKGAHLVTTVYDGLVLLLGEVPSAALKEKATEVTESLYKVDPDKVYNYLTVGGPISLLARTNDSYISGKVITRLLTARMYQPVKSRWLQKTEWFTCWQNHTQRCGASRRGNTEDFWGPKNRQGI